MPLHALDSVIKAADSLPRADSAERAERAARAARFGRRACGFRATTVHPVFVKGNPLFQKEIPYSKREIRHSEREMFHSKGKCASGDYAETIAGAACASNAAKSMPIVGVDEELDR